MGRILSDDDAMAIIRDARPPKQIAAALGISYGLVCRLRRGDLRPHLYAAHAAALSPDSAEWRPISGWPMYEVSDDGRVRNAFTKKSLRPRLSTSGYPIVDLHVGVRYGLSEEAKQTTRLVHALVCEAFHGPCPDGMEVAHNNGIRTDARADNLRWDTHKENSADRVAHDTHNRGARNPGVKLTENDVHAIRRRAAAGESQHALAAVYGVSQPQIGRIISRKKWGWLPDETTPVVATSPVA